MYGGVTFQKKSRRGLMFFLVQDLLIVCLLGIFELEFFPGKFYQWAPEFCEMFRSNIPWIASFRNIFWHYPNESIPQMYINIRWWNFVNDKRLCSALTLQGFPFSFNFFKIFLVDRPANFFIIYTFWSVYILQYGMASLL